MFSSLSFPSYLCLPWIRAQVTGHSGSIGVHFRSSVLSSRAWLWDGTKERKSAQMWIDPWPHTSCLLVSKNKSSEACVTQGFPRCQGLKDTRWPSVTPPPEPFLSSHLSLKFLAFTCRLLFPPHFTRWNLFFFNFYFKIIFLVFIYLATPGLSCSTQGL